MKILTLSTVYPTPSEPGLGLFVRSRVRHIALSEQVAVFAPLPVLDYSNPNGGIYRARNAPFVESDDRLTVYRPRWLYPPGGTPINAFCLYARLLWPLHQLRKRFPFEVLDAHFGYPEGVAAALLSASLRVPFTITLRGVEAVFAANPFRRRAMQWAFRRASHVIGVSEDLSRFALAMGAQPERVTTIPNGIDRDRHFPRDRTAIRAKHGILPRRKVILSAGELIEAKGHHLVMQALKRLLKDGIDAELWIAGGVARGGARYDEPLRALAADPALSGRVRFLGWTPPGTLPELFSAADLFCLASYTEGWPNVVNEALACGAPVVATRVGGVPAMISSGCYGLMVPPRDLESLYGALREGIEKEWDRKAISEWGRSRSWMEVAREAVVALHAASGSRSAVRAVQAGGKAT